MDGSRPRSYLGLPPREEGSDRPHHKAAAKLSHSPHHIASATSPSSSIQGPSLSQAALLCIPAPPKTDECVPLLPALFNTPKPYDPSQTRFQALESPDPYNPAPSYNENAPIAFLGAFPTPPSARPYFLRRGKTRKQGNLTEPQLSPATSKPEPIRPWMALLRDAIEMSCSGSKLRHS